MTNTGGITERMVIQNRCVACGQPMIPQIKLKVPNRLMWEAAFNITIDEDDAMDLYDMFLEDAAKKIIEIQERDW